ncbi:hypothetical protein KIN20_022932 [Parelaphostrongylus tenuis]|uniref:Uncharacterized protein n=1 Tax=Parelaphostrongylus tenuis TaxID=148309 RepID=A0AAD5MUT1_PARTN|nr:hypothetical protein KIN20_022932 [Parelaphostrongylus tenuis]
MYLLMKYSEEMDYLDDMDDLYGIECINIYFTRLVFLNRLGHSDWKGMKKALQPGYTNFSGLQQDQRIIERAIKADRQ